MKNLFKITLVCTLVLIIGFGAFFFGINLGYNQAFKKGYIQALKDIADKTDIDFEWTDLGNGNYKIIAWYHGRLLWQGNGLVDVIVEHRRNGELLSLDRHAGTLTNIGKDRIEQQISGSVNTNSTDDISCSADDSSGMSASSTILTNEITTNGFTRADGDYTSTGTGTWNVTHTFTSSGTQTVQLYGLHWSPTSQQDNCLLCYDTSSAKNTVSGDTLAVTFQCTVT